MPHAIAQCYEFIKKYCPNAMLHHSSSTAGAVAMVDALKLSKESTVIIGHEGISSFYPIHVIEKNIQDQKQNITQFCVIKRLSTLKAADHASCLIAFSTHKDAPGSLLNVLEIFKSQNINLSKILSRPEKSSIGSYIFYVEFPFDSKLNELDDLFLKIKKQSLFFKHIGFYQSQDIHD